MKIIFVFLILTLMIFVLYFQEEKEHKKTEALRKEWNRQRYKQYMDMGFKYAARDQDGTVQLYKYKPFKFLNVWICRPMNSENMKEVTSNYDLFQDVQWSDEKPKSLDDLMNGEI